jgi:membrane protease YdiL (CAAX protease family)
MGLILYGIAIGYLGLVIYLANQLERGKHEIRGSVRALLFLSIFLIFLTGCSVFATAFQPADVKVVSDETPVDISAGWVLASLVITGFAVFAAYSVMTSLRAREFVQRLVGDHGKFSSMSIVHTTAIVLTLLIIVVQINTFIIAGGADALASSNEGAKISILDLFFELSQRIVQIAAAFLGVGLAIRRTLPQSLKRLGLRMPTQEDLGYGFLIGFAMIVGLIIFGIFMTILFTPDQLEQQNEASRNVAESYATIPLAFTIALSAGIAEEIFFRGALQPVFGNVLTSVFFTLLHVQNLLTPGMIVIFGVSLTLGWLRDKQGTTSAMIAHFVYDFTQLFILTILVSEGAG